MNRVGAWHARPNFRASLWVLGALASFSAMAVAGRELGSAMGTFQILGIRSMVGLLLTGALLTATGWRGVRLVRFDLGILAIRNISHFGATYCWFTGLTLLPLSQVFAIEFTAPLWAALLSVALLGERPGWIRAAGIVTSFAGAIVVLNPSPGNLDPASFIVLLAAVGFAIAFVATKRVIGGIPTVVFLFYMSLMQLPLGLLLAWPGWVPVLPASIPWLAVASLGGLTAHFCLVRALKLAEVTIVAPMDFLRLPLIAVVGALVYGERLEVWIAFGAAMVCLGNWLNLRETKKETSFLGR